VQPITPTQYNDHGTGSWLLVYLNDEQVWRSDTQQVFNTLHDAVELLIEHNVRNQTVQP